VVIFAQGLSHQFASFFIAFHPDVSQACPKTRAPETQVDRTEIETYWNQRSPEIVHSLAWLTGMHADSSNARVPALLVGTIEASAGDSVSGRGQVNVTPEWMVSCSTI
jgi:hypothetical protein